MPLYEEIPSVVMSQIKKRKTAPSMFLVVLRPKHEQIVVDRALPLKSYQSKWKKVKLRITTEKLVTRTKKYPLDYLPLR